MKHKNIHLFSRIIFSGSGNPSLPKTRTCLFCKVKATVANDMVRQGAKASAVIVLTYITLNDPVSVAGSYYHPMRIFSLLQALCAKKVEDISDRHLLDNGSYTKVLDWSNWYQSECFKMENNKINCYFPSDATGQSVDETVDWQMKLNMLLLIYGSYSNVWMNKEVIDQGGPLCYSPRWHGGWLLSPRLTHRGRVTHICVSKLTIIGSDNGLSPGRRQANIWTNAGILLFRTTANDLHGFNTLKPEHIRWHFVDIILIAQCKTVVTPVH